MTAYFYFGGTENNSSYYHDYSCIAEGLKELGVECYGNMNMCQIDLDGHYLINYDKQFDEKDADMVFFHNKQYQNGVSMTNELISSITSVPNRKYKVFFIDSADGLITPGFYKVARKCDVVLKCHYNRKYAYPSNFMPWQFGLSNRIINAVHPVDFEKRRNQIIVNFRAKHQLRDYVNSLLKPVIEPYYEWNDESDDFSTKEGMSDLDKLYWKQSGARHYPQYYDKLSNTKLCACYGGVFALPWGNCNKYTARIARNINDVIRISKWDRVRQWDSWRLWEAWAAECCVIHIDLEKYGCTMPVAPENGVDYIGLDMDSVKPHDNKKLLALIESLFSDENRLKEIAANGRKFVLENYSPKVIAERLLRLL